MTRADKKLVELAEVRARHRDELQRLRADRALTFRQRDERIAELEERHDERVEDFMARIKEAQHLDAQDREEAVQELLRRNPNPDRYSF